MTRQPVNEDGYSVSSWPLFECRYLFTQMGSPKTDVLVNMLFDPFPGGDFWF